MRQRSERGAVGGLEGLAFGVLIFVFGTLVITNAWATVDTKLASSAAAREAARAYVEADSATDAIEAARLVAADSMRGHGRSAKDVNVTSSNSGYQRCATIEVTVSADVPRVSLPLIGGHGGTTNVSSRHSEIIDPYRSGLAGEAGC